MLIEELEDEATVGGRILKNEVDSRSEDNADLYPNGFVNDAENVNKYGPVSDPFMNVSSETSEVEREIVQDGSRHVALKLVVGAGARLLFYPTLFYNVVRNKFEADFRWWDEIEPFLLLGAVPFPRHVYRLKSLGVEAVVTLNEPYETLVSSSFYKSQMINHLVIPTRDYLFAPSFENIERAVDFIHSTYVHCKAGRGRSTTIVLCYLVKYRKMVPKDAFNYVQSKRPRVQLAASQWKAVLQYSKFQHFEKMVPLYLSVSQQWPLCSSKLHDSETDRMVIPIQNEFALCGDSPVFVTSSDLEGYEEIEETSNNLHSELGLTYRLGILTAKSVIGVAKASATLARLSYIWLGYQAESQTFNMAISCSPLPDARSQPAEPIVALHVCQQGLVKC
ncbi:hypothetical protein KP509_31G060000 [Ceratopteris richardii]|uniref:phosphatidylglycerophosphatase n=1 Tax=Ceratopteris richardii TaxID=49495 RepID=A0A8T2QYR9_CERRI|nr:hypothetical protein KP509_31G060000 [Ceratopteris richardii]